MSRLDEAAAKRQTSGGGAQGWFLGAEVASHIHLLKFIQTRCDEHVHGCVCVLCMRVRAVWGSARCRASLFILQRSWNAWFACVRTRVCCVG